MKAKGIAIKAKNTAKALAEAFLPINTIENQILTLEGLKVIIEQCDRTQQNQISTPESLKSLNEQVADTRAQLQDLQSQLRTAVSKMGASIASINSAGQTVADQNDPEERLLEFLLPRLNDKTLLDVGAHRGVFTAEMLKIGFKTIHAFEPHPELSRVLAENYRDDPRVTVHPMAVSETEGSAVLHLVERFSNDSGEVDPLLFSSLSPHNMPPGLKFQGEVPVESRPLTSFVAAGTIPSQAGVLKIDAEGCDLSVMKGMPKGAPYEIIISEFWSEDFVFATPGIPAHHVIRDYLRDNGYPHSISIIRRQDESLCFTANMIPRIPQVWGNTLYFRDLDLFDAAYAFMRNTIPQVV